MKRIIYFSFLSFLISISAFCQTTEEILNNLIQESSTKFSSYTIHSQEECFEESKRYRDGKVKDFPENSLKSIMYARAGFSQAAKLAGKSRDFELWKKAGYNYAMLCLTLDDIPQALEFFKTLSLPQVKFEPAVKNYHNIKKIIDSYNPNPLTPKDQLSAELKQQFPYGYLHRDFSEEISQKIMDLGGVRRLTFTHEEGTLFNLGLNYRSEAKANDSSVFVH